jgi:protein-tyrosine-phosphatase/DNA-binding transcriptional ArsR family regulator
MNSAHQIPAPEFLKLLANDVRWQILSALTHSDLRVHEIVGAVARPINLVSYHLKQLREHGLVHERRSSADGRDIYYALDLPHLQELYRYSGALLHPALAATVPPTVQTSRPQPLRVLFLCTQNRARSQMAEGLLRHFGTGQVAVQSAGVRPGSVHPLAAEALAAWGIDIGQQRSKHLDELQGQTFDRVITVCDQVREQCPAFGGDTDCIHWSIADPIAAAENAQTEDARRRLFAQTAQELATRIHFLLLAEQRGAPLPPAAPKQAT